MCELTGQLAACKVCTAENKRLRAENERLKQALNNLAEAAEVAAQGGIHAQPTRPEARRG